MNATSPSSIDLAHLRAWIGRERRSVDTMNPFPAQALAAALDRRQLPGIGDALPLCWHWLYFLDTPAASAMGTDGHPMLGEFLPPAPLPRRMWAAGAMTVEAPLKLGTPAERISRIRAIEAKEGKTGALVFVTLDHLLSQGGRICIREEQNLVYRAMPTGPAPLPPGEAAGASADWSRTIMPDPVLLFRYSALTYNSHRIHYDRQYAVEREHYPALVVHGPLLATLLLELVSEQMPDRRVASFSFRASRPSFDTEPFTMSGALNGEGEVKLWTADAEGSIGMNAKAQLA